MDGVFIGAALPKQMRDTILWSLFIIFLPTWYFSQHLGNHGLWLALTLFMLARSLIMLGIYLYYKNKLLI
jgi:MATE family multidrug resistance protein